MSIFNDKSLKSVAEAAAKIMGEAAQKKANKDYDGDGKVESPKDEVWGSRLKAAKLAGKLKEEEQLDELSKSTVKSYVMKKMEKPTTDKKDVKGLTNAYNRLKNYKPTSESVELDEEKGDVRVRNKTSGKELMIPFTSVKTYEKHGYFPVPGSNVKEGFEEMEKYRKEKEKESAFEKKKTDKGTMYSRKPEKTEKKEVDEGFDAMDKYLKDKNKPQPSGGAGVKQGKAYGGSKQPEEKKSMTEMLELYNEHGLKIVSMIGSKKVNFGETEVEVIDADDVNGVVETVVEEVDNETFTKEVNAQKEKNAGKGKKAEVAKASVQAVKQEEVEHLDELVKIFHRTKPGAKEIRYDRDSPAPEAAAHRKSTADAARAARNAPSHSDRYAFKTGITMNTNKGGSVFAHKEEVEHLDELSTQTLSSYVKKRGSELRGGYTDKKKIQGINKAITKVNSKKVSWQKEEVELGEARKLEGSYSNASGHESKVYKLSGEHNEGDPYHVKLFKGGKHHEPADYFTNDKDDAHSTAKRMVKESLDERHLTAAETEKKEDTVKAMKKNLSGFKARYGDRAKEVMYATATKQAKKD